MYKYRFGLNIQKFAADDGKDLGNNGSSGEENGEEIKFTQADVDRAVSKGIATRIETLVVENQTAIDNAVKAALDEKARLDALSEEERNTEAQRIAAQGLADREAELDRRALTIDIRALLVEEGLPTESLEILMGKDLETSKTNIKVFKDLVGKQVQIEVDAIIKKPGSPGKQSGESTTKEAIMSIKDPQERQRAIADNIELFS